MNDDLLRKGKGNWFNEGDGVVVERKVYSKGRVVDFVKMIEGFELVDLLMLVKLTNKEKNRVSGIIKRMLKCNKMETDAGAIRFECYVERVGRLSGMIRVLDEYIDKVIKSGSNEKE